MAFGIQTTQSNINQGTVIAKKDNAIYYLFLTIFLTLALLVSFDVMAAFDVDAKFNEAETNFRKWFNYGAILALIVSVSLAFKGKINYGWPTSVFGALILVNSATELVSWFGQ